MKTNSITKEEITKAENQLLAAQLAGDIVSLDRLLYNDVIALLPSGQTATKQMDIDTYRSGTVVLEEAIATIEDIRILDDTVLCIVLLTAKGKMMGNPLEGKFRYLRVWKRFEDGLKIIGASFIQVSPDSTYS